MRKLIYTAIGLAFLAFGSLKAEDTLYQPIGPFGGLNNSDNPLVIQSEKAQDLLNVDISPGGKSVKKRKGFGTAFILTHSSMAAHGAHFYYDTSGNDVSLFFNDSYVYSSISGGQPSIVLSTGPAGATWQCVDSAGNAYCANTSRTFLFKYDSSTFSFINSVVSTGTMLSVTPIRLVMAGFSNAPNRIDFSQANDFTNWTPGGYSYSPVNFTVTAPGSRVTHIVYAHERIYWFKQTSFGYILDGPTLADWTMRTVSPNIGTNDNTSVYRDGVLYFRGSDSHIYGYDGSSLVKLTREIQSTTGQTQTRGGNSWTQSTKEEFESGIITPGLSSTILPGSLVNKTSSYIESTLADWSTGTFLTYDKVLLSNTSDYVHGTTGTITNQLSSVFPDTFTVLRNGNSGTMKLWKSGPLMTASVSNNELNLSVTKSDSLNGSFTGQYRFKDILNGTTATWTITKYESSTLPTDYLKFYLGFNNSNGVADDITAMLLNRMTTGYYCIQQVNLPALTVSLTSACTDALPFTTSLYVDTHTIIVSIASMTVRTDTVPQTVSSNGQYPLVASFQSVHSTQSALSLGISRIDIAPEQFFRRNILYDAGISSHTYEPFYFTISTNSGTGIDFYLNSSTSQTVGSSFVLLSSNSVPTDQPHRYITIDSYFNRLSTTSQPISLSQTILKTYSTGTYTSAVNYAPSLSSWDSFNSVYLVSGSSIGFYMRSATYTFTVTSTRPTWVEVGANAIPLISTYPYFQNKFEFVASRSTHTLRLDSFTDNWFEGNAEDKAYAAYHNDGIWWSVTSGTGATRNNKILRYDLVNPNTWTIYDIPTNGMYVNRGNLYFVGSSTGVVYKYGDVDSDNGSAINAYWKSKDFIGTSPFVDNEYTSLSLSASMVANSSMTVTYTINGSSNTSYSMPLRIGNSNFTKFNKYLPLGRTGTYFNVQFGNNAIDQPFEVFGAQYGFRPKPWGPTTP